MSATQYASLVLRTPSKRALPTRFQFRSARRLETFVLAAGICLPVPLLAATGLSVPLPNVVERIAAALVPWAEPVAFGATELQGSSGAIVPTATEKAPAAFTPRIHGSLPSSAARTLPGAKSTGPGALLPAATAPSARPTARGNPAAVPTPNAPSAAPAAQPEVAERTEVAVVPATADAPAAAPRTESPPAQPAQSSSTSVTTTPSTPTPPPAPATTPVVVQTPVVTVPVAVPTPVAPVVEPVVTIVNDTVADPVGTVGGIVANPGGTVGGILKPVLPKLGGK